VVFPQLNTKVIMYRASDDSLQTVTVVTGYKDSGSVPKDKTYTYWVAQ